MKNKKQHFKVSLFFTLCIFLIMSAVFFCTGFLIYDLSKNEGLEFLTNVLTPENFVYLLLVISILLGALVGFFVNYVLLKPVYSIIKGLDNLSKGDYSVRIKISGLQGKFKVFSDMEKKFNSLATELEESEALRSDFINNFSHEFKTPIVSIAGFAKLIKKGKLSKEQEDEYLDIIEKESLRLSSLATNVLNLTRVENKEILTDVSNFNLSEQLRTAVLELSDKWTLKNIEMNMDFLEYFIDANYELLMQVWINLVDNAIKYSPEGGIVTIDVKQKDDEIFVYVVNNGEEIGEEEKEKIFNKFYQKDKSHKTEGNGIGLAIVKKIIKLHRGEVTVKSAEGMNCFIVKLTKMRENI